MNNSKLAGGIPMLRASVMEIMPGTIGNSKMNRYTILLCIIISLLINCSELYGQRDAEKYNLEIDLEKEKALQVKVDEGHQPWRLDAIAVAYETLKKEDNAVDYESCNQSSGLTSTAAIVECKNGKDYRVHLKRLVRKDGIWTAISIEIISKGKH